MADGGDEEAVLRLPALRRYQLFLERVVASGEAWGLFSEGWALAVDEAGRDVLPLWPARGFAERCATRLWEGYSPRAIPLAELEGTLLPELEAGGLTLGVFFTPGGQGYPVTPAQLREDLEAARARLPRA